VLKLDLAIRRVKETTAFTGSGYFGVDKTTVTAMVSTTVTYLIVLLQTPGGGDSQTKSNSTITAVN
jgi:Trehalose receptor